MIKLILFACLAASAYGMLSFNVPRENVWVTFANLTNQNSICLSLGGVQNPFRTCLVGLAVWNVEEFKGYVSNQTLVNATLLQGNCSATPGLTPFQQDGCWQCQIVLALNNTLASPPEELDLFGSANASLGNSTGGWFAFESIHHDNLNRNRQYWASLDSRLDSATVHSQLFTQCNGTNFTEPRALPPGIFLICGDRAWNGIPMKPQGGPCYIGKLAMFHPNITLLTQWSSNQTRQRRSLHDLRCENIGSPAFWSELKQVIVATLLPGGAANKAMNLAKQLGCWAKDELNTTSQVLDMLSKDVESVNHAVLQNRAAIDFLLLAQGHGCEEFEGMCCMNLSDHSESIHKKIREMQNKLHELREEDGWDFEGWLKSLGLTSWVRTIIKYVAIILGLFLCLALVLPCIISCLQNFIEKTISRMWHSTLLAQKENGGSVESFVQEWLDEKGHSQIGLIKLEGKGG